MTVKTYAEQLEAVQTAIEQVELYGQSTADNGKSLTRANLDALYKREQRLRGLVASQTNGGVVVRGMTPCG